MPQLYFTSKSGDREEKYFVEMPRGQSSDDVNTNTTSSTSIQQGNRSSDTASNEEDNSWFLEKYEKLPHHLKSVFDYISVVCHRGYVRGKDEMVRLLVAEGLISQEETGEISEEDVAENIIDDLIGLGMLCETLFLRYLGLQKSVFPEKNLNLIEVDEQNFIAEAANLPVRAVIFDDGMKNPLHFKTLQIRTLFLRTKVASDSYGGLSLRCMQAIFKLQFLQVLYICGAIELLPDEVGNLVHLTHFGLVQSKLDKLPRTLGNLQKLQTFDIRWCLRLRELPAEVLKIQQLRHLLMENSYVRVTARIPAEGIGMLVNLQTCVGLYAGDVIADELGSLTQLRKLGVFGVSEYHAFELASAIMKLENLLFLLLEAEDYWSSSLLPEFQSFSPPCLLQELHLRGGLIELPNWLLSMENLTTLSLHNSNLSEDEVSVLQYIPKLKHLSLWEAFNKVKIISKAFCEAGGFAQLEILKITCNFLVEWTEIENGAFPSLIYLDLSDCQNLRFLPDSLQNISTLQKLHLRGVHGDLARKLQGEENYKIKHISNVLGLRNV